MNIQSPKIQTKPPAKRRLVDTSLCLLVLTILWPLLLMRAIVAYLQQRCIFVRETRVGVCGNYFRQLEFAGSFPGRSLAKLLNIISGELAWVGPRPLSIDEASQIPANAYQRFGVIPGLISPHQVRRSIGIAHDDEWQTDCEFIVNRTFRSDMALLLRAAVARVLSGDNNRPMPETLSFFDVPVWNTTMPEALSWLIDKARSQLKTNIAFVNPDCLNKAYRDHGYKDILCGNAQVFADGIGIHIACRILGLKLAANLNGTDLFPLLCERAAQENLSIFLLGAQPGVAEAAARNLRQRFPTLRIAGTRHGFFDTSEEAGVIEEINDSGADILLVAMGAPRQEQWIAEHHDALKPALRLGVGGLFDFYSNRIPRAPLWLREIGLEWVWRLMQEPGRMWRRYLLGNPLFLYRIWRQAKS